MSQHTWTNTSYARLKNSCFIKVRVLPSKWPAVMIELDESTQCPIKQMMYQHTELSFVICTYTHAQAFTPCGAMRFFKMTSYFLPAPNFPLPLCCKWTWCSTAQIFLQPCARMLCCKPSLQIDPTAMQQIKTHASLSNHPSDTQACICLLLAAAMRHYLVLSPISACYTREVLWLNLAP